MEPARGSTCFVISLLSWYMTTQWMALIFIWPFCSLRLHICSSFLCVFVVSVDIITILLKVSSSVYSLTCMINTFMVTSSL